MIIAVAYAVLRKARDSPTLGARDLRLFLTWIPVGRSGKEPRVSSMAQIRRSRDLGFTLEEIRAMLAMGGPGRAPCADVHRIASAHLANVRTKLADLMKLESIPAETVAQCCDGAPPDCPVLDILDAGWPGD